ncbi:phosphotransferase enzyme family-domain-containing protein [Cyathus striatus]|nr:phosphotransferase enzyme family-domain-containing protein [Cyathus striatus]
MSSDISKERSIYTSTYPLQHGLEWNRDLIDVVPRWTHAPDPDIVLSLAKLHLPQGVEYTVSEFAAGVFNKLFLLSPPNIDCSMPQLCPSSTHKPAPTRPGTREEDSIREDQQCYVMRVSLPVDPHFKTASEVATLHYLAHHTSVPVPRVIAYCSSADNALGFEWILGTRVPGVPLREFWDPEEVHCDEESDEDVGAERGLYSSANPGKKNKLTWKEKVSIVDTLAGYVKQMHGLKLDRMGSLYLAGECHPHLHWLRPSSSPEPSAVSPGPKHVRTPSSPAPPSSEGNKHSAWSANPSSAREAPERHKHHPPNLAPSLHQATPHPQFTPIPHLPEYTLGPAVALPFFYHRRLKLHLDRGPFTTSAEWVRAYLNVQIGAAKDKVRGVREGSINVKGIKFKGLEGGSDEGNSIKVLKGSIRAARSLIPLIPRFFPPANEEHFVLNHLDLSTSNILIDPVSHKITGIVDWEYVSLQPRWKARQPLKFLRGPEINPEWYESEIGASVPRDWWQAPRVMKGEGGKRRATLQLPVPACDSGRKDSLVSQSTRKFNSNTRLSSTTPPSTPVLKKDKELLANLQNQLLRLVCEHTIPSGGQVEKEKRIFEYKIAQTHVDTEQKWEKVLRWSERVARGGEVEQGVGKEESWFEPELFC